MYFLLACLVGICCSLSDAATSTRINYLPNGQVGGYQLIINNTVEPRTDTPLPRDRVSKIVKHSSRSGNTFTTVDEQVVGENSYLNVHRVLKQHQEQARRKYPLKNVLMVPSVRYNNGVAENVKLRFAQIGPYAALIIPVNKSEHDSSAIEHSIPSEIRDSVKAYVEIQEPTPESNQMTSYANARPSTDTPSITSPVTRGENSQQPVPYRKDQYYRYPPAISDSSPSYLQQGKGDTKDKKHPGFVIKVVNPTSGDSQDNSKEFFVPADPGQIVPERDDKIVANPFKHFGSSDSPSSSQFKEIYSKGDPSASVFPEIATGPRPYDTLSDRGEDISDGTLQNQPSRDDSQSNESSRPEQQTSQHFQSSWSLFDTKNPSGHDKFRGPPLDQPEFSDVAPPSDPEHFTDDKSGSDNNTNGQISNFGGKVQSHMAPDRLSSQQSSSLSGHMLASDVLDSTDPQDPTFHDFEQAHLSNEGSAESVDEAHGDNKEKFEQSEQPKQESASAADSAQKVDEFQDKDVEKLPDDITSTGMQSDKEQDKFVGDVYSPTNAESTVGAIHSNQQFSGIQGNNTEGRLGQVAEAVHDSAVVNTDSVPSVSTEQFNLFPGNSVSSQSQFQIAAGETHGLSSKAESAVSSLNQQAYQFSGASDDHYLSETSSNQSDLKFGRFQIGSKQQSELFKNSESASAVDQQSSQFHGTSTLNTATTSDGSGLQFGEFLGGIRQNVDKSGHRGSYSGFNEESNQRQGSFTKNIEQIPSDGLLAAAQSVKINPERLRNLVQDPALSTQFKFLSPDGRTTAILTSNGNLAVVELPSKASLLGQQSGKIVIPETTIPISATSTKIDDVGALANNLELSSFIKQQYNGLVLKAGNERLSSSFDSTVHDTLSNEGSSVSLNGYRIGNALGSIPVEPTPVSSFDATSAAAVAAAAVVADNEHFKQFGSSVQIGTTQLPSDSKNQHFDDFESINGQRFSEQLSSKGTETSGARVTAITNAANNENHLQLTSIDNGESSSNTELQYQHSQKPEIGVIAKGEQETIQHGDIAVSKYAIPAETARIPINLDGSGSVIAGLLHGNVFTGKSDNFRPGVGSELSSIGGSANFNNENHQSYSYNVGKPSTAYEGLKLKEENITNENSSDYQAQSISSHHEQGGNQKNDKGSSVILTDGTSFPNYDTHLVDVISPRVPGNNHHSGGINEPKYLIPLPNRPIPVKLSQTPQPLQYTSGPESHLPQSSTQHHQHTGAAAVNSYLSSPVGPHTAGLLETLNGIFALPRRQT